MGPVNSEARKRREEKNRMCDAKVRLFTDGTELTCEIDHPSHYNQSSSHHATLYDYAYPGSETTIYWDENDRRNFRGEWFPCESATCILPRGHHGAHTQ